MNIKFQISLMLSLTLSTLTMAWGAELVHRDVILYSRNQFYVSDSQLPILDSLAKLLCADSSMHIEIYGYGDAIGGKGANETISQERAEWAAYYIMSKGGNRVQISFEGRGVDYEAKHEVEARRLDIFGRTRVEVQGVGIDVESVEIQGRATVTKMEVQRASRDLLEVQELVVAKNDMLVRSGESGYYIGAEGGVSLRTNLLYWLVATPNVGVEYRSSNSKFGYLLNVGYAPLSSQSWDHNFSGYFVAPELRLYVGKQRRGYVGAQLAASGYNVKLSDTGYQGDLFGAGLVGGCRLFLTDRFDLDLSLGAGYALLRYDSYHHISANDTCVFIDRDVEQWRWMPLQAGVSLIWKINK